MCDGDVDGGDSVIGRMIVRAVLTWYDREMHARSQAAPRRVASGVELTWPQFGLRVQAAMALLYVVLAIVLVSEIGRSQPLGGAHVAATLTFVGALGVQLWALVVMRRIALRLNGAGVQFVRWNGRVDIVPWSAIESVTFAWQQYRVTLRNGRRYSIPIYLVGISHFFAACREHEIPTPWRFP